MTIFHSHKDEDGNLRFFVPSKSYPSILARLKEKGLSAGGNHDSTAEDSEIVVAASIDEVNAALADFEA